MKNKTITLILLLAAGIGSGYIMYEILKKIGLGDTFDFDLFEDIDEEEI